ncbi:MAG TPA: hypothetical protein VMA37_00095 [Acetobacteraceae bacterium]|nr:hypothetical protein [Acetobacteraceae bacterium]
MPYRHVNNHQIKLFMRYRQSDQVPLATAMAEEATADAPLRKYVGGYLRGGIAPILKAEPGLRAVAMIEETVRRHQSSILAYGGRWSAAPPLLSARLTTGRSNAAIQPS